MRYFFLISLLTLLFASQSAFSLITIGSSGSGEATAVTAPLTLTGTTVAIPASSASVDGYLSSANFTIFNNKAAVTNPTRDTTNFSFDALGSVLGNTVAVAKLGRILLVQGHIYAGTPAGTTFAINIPAAYGAIDTAAYPTSTNDTVVGWATRSTAGGTIPATANGPWPVFYDGSTNNKLFMALAWAAGAAQLSKANGSAFIGAGQTLSFNFTLFMDQ